MDTERARHDSPYLVAAELLPVENPSSLEDLDCWGESELFTYDAVPRLFEEGVIVLREDRETVENEHGLSSFIRMVGKCHTLKHGDRARLEVERLWWRPGKLIRNFFHEPGEWGIATAADSRPTEWRAVNKLPVFTFTDASNWEVDAIDWTVGTRDIVAFLRGKAWAGFDPESDEHDRDEMQLCFDESIDRLLREIIGNCVPVKFNIYELQAFMPTKEAHIREVRYHYPDEKHTAPHEVTATNARGEEVRLRFL
ncbi:MAG: hypothetical protein ACRD9R_01500 [Pyrinomonadaceae bacterium]